MVAATDIKEDGHVDDPWRPTLDRMRHELDSAARSSMYGDLTLTVTFVAGEAMTETIGVVHRRKLMKP